MIQYPEIIENEEHLEEMLSQPSEELVEMMRTIEGDFIFLGVAGKIGVSMARMAKKACEIAQVNKRIVGVARFSDAKQQTLLEASGIETIKGDLLESDFVNSLPEIKNVVFLAGMKFGTDGNESFTWAMNSFLPGLIVERFKNSRIVAFSTGCVYPLATVASGGCKEIDDAGPVGEYAQSCLGRERLFEFGSIKNNTPVVIIRLNYAVEPRYGVLVDIARKIYNEETIDLTMGYANVIWQGDANDMILRSIQFCESPAKHLNISGPEIISVEDIAKRLGELLDKPVKLQGKQAETALLINVAESQKILGTRKVSVDQVLKWTAEWIANDNRLLGKPTHFEVRDGKY
ncbi:epimerase [Kriegella sp. EG-1]|nr:epimerase [Flavobacteriaceae bacterium EG-1]